MKNFEELTKLEIGDILYECDMGLNLRFKVVSKPIVEDDKVKWDGEIIDENGNPKRAGEIINYLVTKGFGHYGPKIYDYPAYI